MAETLFKDLQVASVLFCPGSALALLPSGIQTGIVCELGAEEVRIAPIYDGEPILAGYPPLPPHTHASHRTVRCSRLLLPLPAAHGSGRCRYVSSPLGVGLTAELHSLIRQEVNAGGGHTLSQTQLEVRGRPYISD